MRELKHGSAALAALALSLGLPVAAPAQPDLVVTFANPPYSIASSCIAGQPVADVFVVLRNSGNTNAPGVQVTASDTTDTLVGDAANVAAIPPGAAIAVTMHMRPNASGKGSIGGAHAIGVAAGLTHAGPLTLTLPSAFCLAAQDVKTRAIPAVLAVSTPSPSPAVKPLATQRIADPSRLTMVTLGVPTNVRNVAGGTDCGAHVGPIGALVCPDMIKSGDLLLVWDWQPGSGPPAIDGYRVYRVDNGGRALVTTQSNKKDLTLADLPKSGGYAGHCYAVVAYDAIRESALSAPYCANGASAARTDRLSANHVRSSVTTRSKTAVGFVGNFNQGLDQSGPVQVGFDYSTVVSTFADGYNNEIRRSGVAFDVSSLANRKLVSAKLHVTLAQSDGQGNNHSCTTTIGTGTEFWWQNNSWIQGTNFSFAPTDVGPDISADVTPVVASWLIGNPNYGFVLRNDDENLAAFTNKRCRTAYVNPTLEVTYY